MDPKSLEQTNKLLRVIVGLLIRQKLDQTSTLREQISMLGEFGLSPTDIAATIGRSSNYVNKELFELRKINKNNK